MTTFEAHMAHYRAEHRSLGCKISHMIGVPLIVASLGVLLIHWPMAIGMFVVGWTFQLAGHRYFERNRPVLAADPKNPLTYLAAVVFVSQEWATVLTGRRLIETAPVDTPPTAPKRAA
jgi:uncharacterized membrane protein YGL010W